MSYILEILKYEKKHYFRRFLLGFPEITPLEDLAKKFDFKEEASLTKYKLQGKFKIIKTPV